MTQIVHPDQQERTAATERLREMAREAQTAYDAYRRFIAAWVKEQQ